MIQMRTMFATAAVLCLSGGLARGQELNGKVEAAALFVADNVLSHADALGAYSRARQEDPTLESVTVPLDRGLELSVVLSSL